MRRGAKRHRDGSATRGGRGGSSGRDPTAGALVARGLRTFFGSLPTIACVALATALPSQLLLAWLYVVLGIQGDPFWQAQYMLLVDMSVGSLTIPAVYIAIRGCIDEPGRLGPLGWVRRAYREAVGLWLGSFLTRLMVSFVVGVTGMVPVLVGWALLSSWNPRLAALAHDPTRALEALSASDLATLLLLAPLALFGVVVLLWYALADVVVALERKDGFAALQRSKVLTKGARLPLLAGLALLSGPLQVADLFVTGVGSEVGVWAGALIVSAFLVAGALPGAFLVHVYLSRPGVGGGAEERGAQNPEAR